MDMALKSRTPTKAEKEWMDKVKRDGCIVCWVHHGIPNSQCDVHHLDGKVKKHAHLNSIGLCYNHHREGSQNGLWVSRHPWKKAFIERYGTEEYLLEEQKKLMGIVDESSK